MSLIQLKPPEEALVRIKEAADVLKTDTKKELQKKAWPYIRNSLRLSVLYLRLDINTCIASKPKAEKKALTAEAKKLNDAIEAVRGHLQQLASHRPPVLPVYCLWEGQTKSSGACDRSVDSGDTFDCACSNWMTEL